MSRCRLTADCCEETVAAETQQDTTGVEFPVRPSPSSKCPRKLLKHPSVWGGWRFNGNLKSQDSERTTNTLLKWHQSHGGWTHASLDTGRQTMQDSLHRFLKLIKSCTLIYLVFAASTHRRFPLSKGNQGTSVASNRQKLKKDLGDARVEAAGNRWWTDKWGKVGEVGEKAAAHQRVR